MAPQSDTNKIIGPEAALAMLMAGNVRFMTGKSESTTGFFGRQLAARKQNPFATIVGCSDSRLGPEIIFDQGIGDIFVIRTAGQVVDSIALGSVEYSVEHLHVPLIMVLGHKRCGAVTAAVEESEEPGDIATLIKAIRPAVEVTKDQPGDHVENAVRAQAINVANQLRGSEPVLGEKVVGGHLKVVAARYDLNSGGVEIL